MTSHTPSKAAILLLLLAALWAAAAVPLARGQARALGRTLKVGWGGWAPRWPAGAGAKAWVAAGGWQWAARGGAGGWGWCEGEWGKASVPAISHLTHRLPAHSLSLPPSRGALLCSTPPRTPSAPLPEGRRPWA